MIWRQILVIAWAQLRTARNHLPRTGPGGVLMWIVGALFYGVYALFGVLLAAGIPHAPAAEVEKWLPLGLLLVFLYWQIVPLFTLSSGWSLQVNKLQIYPIPHSALFGIEVFLRLTSAPDMLLLLAGALVGLIRRPGLSWFCPLLLLLYVPFNLFVSLGIRDLILHSFERNRFRELFAILLVSIGLLPQLLLRTNWGHKSVPYLLTVSRSEIAPWHEVASLTLGGLAAPRFGVALLWIALAYVFARRQFQKSLVTDDSFRPGGAAAIVPAAGRAALKAKLNTLPSLLFADPFAALVQKEFQTLLRMPRFRVIFGMACVFSVIVFVPLSLREGSGASFLSSNFLPVVNLYGLLLLSDVLLLNVFGFDRRAAQIYFVAPVPFKTILRAKNLTAACFIVIQSLAVLIVATAVRASVTALNIGSGMAASAVVATFLLAVGNLTSVSMPRPIDATQTFKKQAGGRMQLWLLLCSAGIFILVGFAFLARWALQSDLALLTVLLFEFAIGLISYFVATDSAVERGMRDREKLVEALSKSGSPIGLS